MSRDEIRTEHLATRVMGLGEGPKGYHMFKEKEDGCLRAVFRPGGDSRPTLRLRAEGAA